jgi:hypothetical protein
MQLDVGAAYLHSIHERQREARRPSKAKAAAEFDHGSAGSARSTEMDVCDAWIRPLKAPMRDRVREVEVQLRSTLAVSCNPGVEPATHSLA